MISARNSEQLHALDVWRVPSEKHDPSCRPERPVKSEGRWKVFVRTHRDHRYALSVPVGSSSPRYSLSDAFRDAAQKVDNAVQMSPRIMRGAPCIAGTRIPIYAIMELLEEGVTVKRILKWFPELTVEDVRMAIRFTRFVLER